MFESCVVLDGNQSKNRFLRNRFPFESCVVLDGNQSLSRHIELTRQFESCVGIINHNAALIPYSAPRHCPGAAFPAGCTSTRKAHGPGPAEDNPCVNLWTQAPVENTCIKVQRRSEIHSAFGLFAAGKESDEQTPDE